MRGGKRNALYQGPVLALEIWRALEGCLERTTAFFCHLLARAHLGVGRKAGNRSFLRIANVTQSNLGEMDVWSAIHAAITLVGLGPAHTPLRIRVTHKPA